MQFGLKDSGSVSLFFSQTCESNPIFSGCIYYKYHDFPCKQPLPLFFLHPAVTNFPLLSLYLYIIKFQQVAALQHCLQLCGLNKTYCALQMASFAKLCNNPEVLTPVMLMFYRLERITCSNLHSLCILFSQDACYCLAWQNTCQVCGFFVLLLVVIAGICSSIPCRGSALNHMQHIKLIKPYCVERPVLCFIFNKRVFRDFQFWQSISCLHSPVWRGNGVGCCERTGWHKHLCITSPVPSS